MDTVEIIKKVVFGIISLLGFILMTISIVLLFNFSFETRLDYTIGTLLFVLIIVGFVFGVGSLVIIGLIEMKKEQETIMKQITKDLESPKLIKFQRSQIKNKFLSSIWLFILPIFILIVLTWISNDMLTSGNINLALSTLFLAYSLIIPAIITFGIALIISYLNNRKLLRNHDNHFAEESNNNAIIPQYDKKTESYRGVLITYTDDFYCGKCGTNINSKMFQKAKNNVIEPNGTNHYLCKKCDKKSLIRVIITSFLFLGFLMYVILILAITLLIDGINIYQGVYFSLLILLTILFPNIWVLFFIPTLLYFYFQHKNRYI